MPIAFLGALALLATRTCSSEVASVDIRLVFGDAGAQTRSLQVEVFRGDDREALAEYKQTFDQDGATKPLLWKVQLDPGMYILEFRVRHAGTTRQFKKSIKAVNDATISVDLEPHLQAKRRPPE